MFIHYFGTAKTKFVVLSSGPVPKGETIQVSGKAEARQIAAQRNATPYNF